MRPLVAPHHSLLYNGLDSNIKERVQSVVKDAAKLSSSPFFFCYQPFFFSPLCCSALAKRNAESMETRENKDFRAEFIPVNVFLIHVFLRIQEYIAVYIDVSEELHTSPIKQLRTLYNCMSFRKLAVRIKIRKTLFGTSTIRSKKRRK